MFLGLPMGLFGLWDQGIWIGLIVGCLKSCGRKKRKIKKHPLHLERSSNEKN